MKPSVQEPILIHQALFGYDAGHHLLRTSTQLAPEVSRALSVATDLSGSPPKEGYEMSFTGMPLPGTEYYGLFCTWLAPEMPRPGCVWSHVLLIDIAEAVITETQGLQLIDPDKLKSFGRMAGTAYARTSDRFDLVRPSSRPHNPKK